MEIYGFIPLLITLVMNYTTGHRVFTKDELKDVYKYFDGSGCQGDTRNIVATKKKYFRYLERSHKDPNILYVGAMNNVYKIDMTDMSCLNYNESRPTNDTIRRCYIQGKEKEVECQNHIRVVMEMPDKLLVCGTGGYAPIKYHLTDHLQINETSNGVAYCPFDPWDNYTAILISEGNPGDQVVPYFGTYTDFIKSSPVFYRPKFEGRTNGVSYSEKTTDREEIGWLNSPQFVGSFDDEEKVIFFFRETSVENKINRNKIYSRVGKVCKQDLGGGFNEMATKTKWLSFQKARLICSLPGTSPHYFDDIYDVYQTGDYFYALFYKQKEYDEDNVASAICVYRMSDIETAFNGRFKYRKSNGDWDTVPDANDPNPRLDNCTAHKTNRDIFNNKVSMYQLMDTDVKPVYGRPIYFKTGKQFIKIAVSETKTGEGETGRNIYIASDEGEIHDILMKTFETGSPSFHLEHPSTIYRPFTDKENRNYSIWNMKFVDNSLVLGTDFNVTYFNIDNICSKIRDINVCITNTRCKWAKGDSCKYCMKANDTTSCKTIDWYNVKRNGAIISIREEIEIGGEKQLRSVAPGLYVTVPFQAKIFTDSQSIIWYQNIKCDGKNILQEYPEKYAISLSNELIIKNVSKVDDQQHYSVCYQGQGQTGLRLEGYKISVKEGEADIIEVWKQQFNDWSTAFVKWKGCANSYYETCQAGNG